MKSDYEIVERSDYEVIDNFLPSDVFTELYKTLLSCNYDEPKPLWQYVPSITQNDKNWKVFNLVHMVMDTHHLDRISPLYNNIAPHIESLNIKSLIRIKINMYPNTQETYEHGMHTDFPFPHIAALLSINTCNGYTKLEDGTKIDSVENRMLIFDASKDHCSSTCTDQPVRVNININYF